MGRGGKSGRRCARRWAPDSRDGEARFGTGGQATGRDDGRKRRAA